MSRISCKDVERDDHRSGYNAPEFDLALRRINELIGAQRDGRSDGRITVALFDQLVCQTILSGR
jgi:hypothetical protein